MTACCYAACGKEAPDNADQGPQRGRGERRRNTARYRCHSSSLFEGGGRERGRQGKRAINDSVAVTQREMSQQITWHEVNLLAE